MKMIIIVFMVLGLPQAFCFGVSEKQVNIQEIDLTDIDDITIAYKS